MRRTRRIFRDMILPPRGVNGTPDETGRPPVNLPGHGRLHSGYGTTQAGRRTEKPHIWIWIEPGANPNCNEYRFYQFFIPKFYMLEPNDIDANGVRKPNVRPQTRLPELTAATGSKFKFNRWNPDYHKQEAKDENEQRRRDGKPRLPTHKPRHLRPPTGGPKVGRPFIQYGVPGSNPGGTTPKPGLLDGPNFSDRPAPDELSPAEFLFLRKKRPNKGTGDQPPPPQQAIVEIEVNFQTCLACVDNGTYKCLKCLNWVYRERTTLRTEWTRDHSPPSTPPVGLGPPPKRWKLGVNTVRSTATITIGNWINCP